MSLRARVAIWCASCSAPTLSEPDQGPRHPPPCSSIRGTESHKDSQARGRGAWIRHCRWSRVGGIRRQATSRSVCATSQCAFKFYRAPVRTRPPRTRGWPRNEPLAGLSNEDRDGGDGEMKKACRRLFLGDRQQDRLRNRHIATALRGPRPLTICLGACACGVFSN